MRTEHTVSFKTLSTFKVGGVAARVMYPESHEECVEVFKKEREILVLGGGSNILPPDSGYPGTVLIPAFSAISILDDGESMLVTADAGVVWDTLVARVGGEQGWGFENLSGIPGTVGGAVFQNIGAYGAVLSDTLVSVRAYSRKRNITQNIDKEACAFGYRTSLFKQEVGDWIILSATFRLTKKPSPNLTYPSLRDLLEGRLDISMDDIRRTVLSIRNGKFPNLAKYGTAGSFFLNPVVSLEEAERFQMTFPGMPVFALPEGGVKIPLAWLLDNVLTIKGMRCGGAFVWPQQALVIATEDGATAHDVRTLQKNIEDAVFKKTKLTIVPEIRIL